jgi:hypothetical protein
VVMEILSVYWDFYFGGKDKIFEKICAAEIY